MKHRKATKSAATLLSLVAMASSQAPLAMGQVAGSQAAAQGSTSSATSLTGSPPASSSQAGAKKSTVKKSAVKRAVAAPAKPPKPPWDEFKLDPKTTMQLDFTDSNPDSILAMFAHTSGVTIVKDPSLKATLTVQSAKPVHLDDAFNILNTVLKLNGFELQKQDGLLVAAKKSAAPAPGPVMAGPPPAPAAPPAEESIVRFYPLQYANATNVAKVINEVFSQQALETMVQQLQQGGGFQGGPPQFQQNRPQPQKVVRASAEDYSNTVIVNAPAKNQKDVEALIKQIDISTETPLESQIFQFKFVTVDEVVDAIKDVLTSNSPTGRGSAKSGNENNNNGFYYYNPFRQENTTSAGAQSVVAIKQTNSIIVTATKENMALVKKLVENLDTEANYVGTTSVIHLENAKATDVATLLNSAFTKRRDQNSDNPFFFIYSDYPSQGNKTEVANDLDENGRVVNVRDLTGKVNIVADPNTNSLIVVTLPSNLKLIRKIVDAIDVVSAQVMIETIIVEASLDKTTKLGVEWNFTQNSVLGNNTTTAQGTQDFGLQSNPLPQGFRYTLTAQQYQAFLNALETNNRYKILDTPRVFTSNNVQAKIDVSQQYPYTQNQSTTIGAGLFGTTSFLPIGVVLTVTPRITAAREVAMDVDQTADDLQGLNSAGAPIVNHREAKSTVTIHDGETILLGGIISHNLTINESKVPILGDIPLLGKLFQSSSRENTQTELMVFMTPHIVVAPADAIKIREVGEKEMSRSSHESVDQAIKAGEIKH